MKFPATYVALQFFGVGFVGGWLVAGNPMVCRFMLCMESFGCVAYGSFRGREWVAWK